MKAGGLDGHTLQRAVPPASGAPASTATPSPSRADYLMDFGAPIKRSTTRIETGFTKT
jgi:hypothetical protein